MADVPYRGYVITIGSRRLDSGQWLPQAVVHWVEFGARRSRPIEMQRPATFETPDAAEDAALRLGQGWVDDVR